MFCVQSLDAQQIIFSENFESKELGPAWQIVSGNWHIADVQQLRIAPAEDGHQYVLCSDSAGFIRLFVDIPDLASVTQIKLSFSYYTYLKGPGASIEVEFHKKHLKDGIKGKLWKANLQVKGRWIRFQKILKIPAGANTIQLVFELAGTGSSRKNVCFDSVTVSSLK